MYAVIQTGGKQYRVQPGDIIQIEKLDGEVGAAVKFDQILFSSNANAESPKIVLGKPLLSGAAVTAEIVGQGRGEKSLIIKMKRRKQYRRTQGHRQYQTQVLVTGVDNGAGDKALLSAEDKSARLAKFHSQLAPKGPAFTPKTLGSRKRMLAALAPSHAGGHTGAKAQAGTETETAPKKARPTGARKTTGTKKKTSK